ncbi:MAG: hypothetical protein DMG17_14185 [Acidobacteria bacterium]|nr:MAG: hypothetical protein DMG17_14185 [Acidobacteriota bacterium]
MTFLLDVNLLMALLWENHMATRRELIGAVATRYHAGTRTEKKEILDEFVNVTGFHRKHAIRVLAKMMTSPETPKPPPRSRLYDEAVEAALNLRHDVDRLANDQD